MLLIIHQQILVWSTNAFDYSSFDNYNYVLWQTAEISIFGVNMKHKLVKIVA